MVDQVEDGLLRHQVWFGWLVVVEEGLLRLVGQVEDGLLRLVRLRRASQLFLRLWQRRRKCTATFFRCL